jgi:23S rRNA (adenine2503-C2)-methyltransferase
MYNLFNMKEITTLNLSKPCLSGLSETDMVELIEKLKWPSFKGKQLHSWIYKRWASSFDEMSDLSKKERDILRQEYDLSLLKLASKEESKDKTIKYLWEFKDGSLVESVRMYLEDHESYSACISSQVGCAIGCPFCATGYLGFKKNLNASEIVDQIVGIERDTKERISNVVFMGQGEPLLNYDEVIKAIYLIKDSVGIGARHITLSTSGIAPGIRKLAEEKLQITLAVSLHAPDQETREVLVPIAKKYKMHELMDSLHYYYEKTKRRITFEYVMLDNVNDQIEKAKALSDLVKGLHCHINLIPYNPITADSSQKSKEIAEPAPSKAKGSPHNDISILRRPPMSKIYKFKEVLEETSHKKVTIRHERGTDINAACGQLANKHEVKKSIPNFCTA